MSLTTGTGPGTGQNSTTGTGTGTGQKRPPPVPAPAPARILPPVGHCAASLQVAAPAVLLCSAQIYAILSILNNALIVYLYYRMFMLHPYVRYEIYYVLSALETVIKLFKNVNHVLNVGHVYK